MKITFLVLAISANVCIVFGASTTYAKPKDSFEEALEAKCFENSHNKYAYQTLQEAFNNYHQCENKALNKRLPHPVEEHNEFCKYFNENGYYTCMKNLAANVLPCLDKTEIFFPHMILKAYNTTFSKLCGTFGLIETEYIFDKLEKNQECLYEVVSTLARDTSCIANLTVYKNLEENIIDLNKHDYCLDMKSFVSCATEIIEEKCVDDFTLILSEVSELFLGVCKD